MLLSAIVVYILTPAAEKLGFPVSENGRVQKKADAVAKFVNLRFKQALLEQTAKVSEEQLQKQLQDMQYFLEETTKQLLDPQELLKKDLLKDLQNKTESWNKRWQKWQKRLRGMSLDWNKHLETLQRSPEARSRPMGWQQQLRDLETLVEGTALTWKKQLLDLQTYPEGKSAKWNKRLQELQGLPGKTSDWKMQLQDLQTFLDVTALDWKEQMQDLQICLEGATPCGKKHLQDLQKFLEGTSRDWWNVPGKVLLHNLSLDLSFPADLQKVPWMQRFFDTSLGCCAKARPDPCEYVPIKPPRAAKRCRNPTAPEALRTPQLLHIQLHPPASSRRRSRAGKAIRRSASSETTRTHSKSARSLRWHDNSQASKPQAPNRSKGSQKP